MIMAMGGSVDEVLGISNKAATEPSIGVEQLLREQLHKEEQRYSKAIHVLVGVLSVLAVVLIVDLFFPGVGWVQY